MRVICFIGNRYRLYSESAEGKSCCIVVWPTPASIDHMNDMPRNIRVSVTRQGESLLKSTVYVQKHNCLLHGTDDDQTRDCMLCTLWLGRPSEQGEKLTVTTVDSCSKSPLPIINFSAPGWLLHKTITTHPVKLVSKGRRRKAYPFQHEILVWRADMS